METCGRGRAGAPGTGARPDVLFGDFASLMRTLSVNVRKNNIQRRESSDVEICSAVRADCIAGYGAPAAQLTAILTGGFLLAGLCQVCDAVCCTSC